MKYKVMCFDVYGMFGETTTEISSFKEREDATIEATRLNLREHKNCNMYYVVNDEGKTVWHSESFK